MEEKDIQIFAVIRQNWQVMMVIVSIIFSWAYFQFSLSQLRVDLTGLANRVNSVELKAGTIDSVQGDLKGINAKLDIILRKVQL